MDIQILNQVMFQQQDRPTVDGRLPMVAEEAVCIVPQDRDVPAPTMQEEHAHISDIQQ